MADQPEALRLADALENLEATGWGGDCFALTEHSEQQAQLAAAELRRLAAVEAERNALRADAGRWALLLHAAGRVLQAVDDGYLQPDPETLQGGIVIDALREAWGAFAPARIKGGGNG